MKMYSVKQNKINNYQVILKMGKKKTNSFHVKRDGFLKF